MTAKNGRTPPKDAPWRSRIVRSEEVDPSQLLANPNNWRTHPGRQRDALRGSLSTVGWVQQVIVNTVTGHLVDGHARVEEAISRNEPTVPVLYVELSPEEEALVLATLDPIAAMAIPDDDRLRELLADVTVDDEGLRRLLGDLAGDLPSGGLTDPDDAPDLGEKSGIKPGDLFALGDHHLMCGDASVDLPRLMGDVRADCVWTDPPYGVGYVGKTADSLTLKNDDAGAADLVRTVFAAALPLVADRAPFYCAGPPGRHITEIPLAIMEAGWQFHQELVWVKDVFVLGHSDYHFQHEPIFYGYVGSGSTLIAAERLGRRCYAMDIDPRYVAVAIERWESFTGKKAVRV